MQHEDSNSMACAVVRRYWDDAWREDLLTLCHLPTLAKKDDSSMERFFREVNVCCVMSPTCNMHF